MRATGFGSTRQIAIFLLWVLWMAPFPASAADIVVTSATPSSAEQGTQDLLVTIKGSGFPRNATVRYCRSGSVPEDCSEINVNSTRIKGTTTIETVIDIAPSEITESSFDILVIEPLSGRKGRGTSLFKVVKTNNHTLQPPDPVVIEQADAIETAVSITWPVPLDPNTSDYVSAFDVRYSTSPIASLMDFSLATPAPEGLLDSGASGTLNMITIRDLEPGVRHYVAVRAIDNTGEISDLAPSSVVAVDTASTYPTSHAPATWVSETVEAITEYPGSWFGPCCRLEKLDFDAGGNPAVAYEVPGNSTVPAAVRYAARTPSGWVLENAFNGSVDGISELRHAPGSSGAGLEAGAPGLIVTQDVRAASKGRTTYETHSVFQFRTATAAWTSETLPTISNRGYKKPELEYFLDRGIWKPGTVRTEEVALSGKTTTTELSLAARQSSGGSAQWTKEVVFDCRSVPGTEIRYPKMLRNADGALDVFVSLSTTSGAWLLLAHRNTVDETWSFRRTGLSQDALGGTLGAAAYAMDDSGQLYAVVAVTNEAGMDEVVLFEGMQLDDLPVGEAPCSMPQPVASPATRTVIDHASTADVYAGYPDGNIVGTLPYGTYNRISGFALEYLNGAVDPAIHVMYELDNGDHRIREQRVLSRCGGPGAEWYRDAVDRAYGDTESRAVFSNGPDFGIAWAHHVGRHRYQTSFTSYEERMLYTHRVGSVCSAP